MAARPGASDGLGQGLPHTAGIAAAHMLVELEGHSVIGPCLLALGGGPEGVTEQFPASGTPAGHLELVELGDRLPAVRFAGRKVADVGVGAGEPGKRPRGVEWIESRQKGAAGAAERVDGPDWTSVAGSGIKGSRTIASPSAWNDAVGSL